MNGPKTKCIFLVLDGLGDLPIAELNHQTPLEAAHTPCLDQLASSGLYGLVDPIEPGVVPNTHSGTGILFGLPAEFADKLSRGPVEAAGAGRQLKPGELALRANFATLEPQDNTFVVLDRRAGRITEGTSELAESISPLDLGDGVTAEFIPTDQHRGVLILSGMEFDPLVSDSDPGEKGRPVVLFNGHDSRNGSSISASKISDFIRQSYQILKDHPINQVRIANGQLPANGIITRGAGTHVDLPNAINQLKLNATLISGCNTVRGLGRMFGFEVVNDSRFTADADTDIAAKIECALDRLNHHDIAFVHIKAPDIFSHDRQPLSKKAFLEKVDQALLPLMGQSCLIAVTADHTTDSNTGSHTADPVPSLLSNGKGQTGDRIQFGERSCRNGNMERQTSAQFLQATLSEILEKSTTAI